jgi:pimeloyl-ACP methyl ester carboxylesterase
VCARLRALPAIRARADVGRIGVFGHSIGGRAATSACLDDPLFVACASLDGAWHGLPLMPAASRKPFMLLLNSEGGRETPKKIATKYVAAWSDPVVAIVGNSKHSSFSDAAGPDQKTAHDIIIRLIAAFFEEHLVGRGSVRATIAGTSGVEPVDLAALIR